MGRQLTLLCVAAGLLGAPPGPAAGQAAREGGGLPDGAVLRFGETGFRPPSEVYVLAYSADASYLATAGDANKVCLWDAATGRLVKEFPGHRHLVRKLVFSPDGKFLAAVGLANEIRVWGLGKAGGHEFPGADLAFAADGKTAFVGGTWEAEGKEGRPPTIR